MKLITWIGFATVLLSTAMQSKSQPLQVKINHSGPNNVSVSWPTRSDRLYRVHTTTNVAGSWKPSPAVIQGNGAQKGAIFPAVRAQEYFRVAERVADATTSLSDTMTASGTLQFNFEPYLGNDTVDYVALYDAFQNSTNHLGLVDVQASHPQTFTVNTVHMRNGQHTLYLEIVGKTNFGLATPMVINVTNNLSVLSQTPTEFMRYLEVHPYTMRGTYSIVVKDDQGTTVQSTNRTIQGALSTNGTIIFKDAGRHFTNNYASAHFTYFIDITPEGGTTTSYSFVSPTISAIEEMEGLAVAELLPFVDQAILPELNSTMFDVINYYSLLSNPFFFDTLTREATNEKWNRVDANTYGVWNQYLLGAYLRSPSHGYFLCPGGPGYLGTRSNDPNTGITPTTLSGLRLSNRMTHIFFDGFNTPKSLIAWMTGITDLDKRSNRTTLINEGRRPRFVMYWEDTPFPYTPASNTETDIPEAHSLFVQDLHKELWEPDFFGYPAKHINAAISTIKSRYPTIASKLRFAGSFNEMFVDETVSHWAEFGGFSLFNPRHQRKYGPHPDHK